MKFRLLIAFIALLLLLSVASKAQSCKPKFRSINQVGMVMGGSGNDPQLQTINGFAVKSLYAGVGIGIDYYHTRTVPVFLDLRKALSNKPQTPFVYADLGVSLPWDKGSVYDTEWKATTFDKGLYFDLGVGYTVPVSKKFALQMSFGYSEKKLQEHSVYMPYAVDFPPYYNDDQEETIKYDFKRFSLKMGLSF